ncbi:MAG TPA: outer membrane protein transport protein [bacterium]|nr:outer membrane protein transport protein [bacterium]
MRSGGIGAILALALVSCAWGYGYLGLGPGTAVFQGSSRGGGMGETGMLSEDTPLAVMLNPALLAHQSEKQATLVYRAAALDENWEFPVYDSFDAILGYDTYSTNSHLYHGCAGGLGSGVLKQAWGLSFGAAAGLAYDFRYDYAEEVLDRTSTAQPPDRVIARNSVRGRGEITSISFGLGKTVYPGLALGAGLDYLTGRHDLEARIVFRDENRIPWASKNPDTSATFSARNLSGVRLTVGAAYDLGERVSLGATYKSAAELDGDISASGGGGFGTGGGLISADLPSKVKYPASYALGATFKPRNVLLTVVEGDVTLVKWSDVRDVAAAGETGMDDTYEWHLGVEHIFYNEHPLRFGFLYKPSPEDKETSEAAVTAGTGFSIAGFGIDLAAKVGWRDYREPDLFKDDIFGAKLRGSTDVVRDTNFGGLVTITRRF